MNVSKKTGVKMIVDLFTVGEMSKMSLNEMTLDEMTLDEMTI
jgi:hypothetical protein